MNEIDQEIEILIKAVKKSNTYKEYDKQKNLLKQDAELKKQVDAYRLENFRLQNSQDDGHLAERMDAFLDKYSDFVEIPLVADFLDAEYNLCSMLQELTSRVVSCLDFE